MPSVITRGAKLSPDQVLRAVNIMFDADQPARIAHFVPTAKTARLIGQLLNRDDNASYLVVAPYGSGKSLTATFYLQTVENAPSYSTVLKDIASRFEYVDTSVADDLLERVDPSQGNFFHTRGIGIALSGFQPNLARALKHSLIASFRRIGLAKQADEIADYQSETMDQAIALLSKIRDSLAPHAIDRIAILWDEFGRHLEELVNQGLASSLNDIQLLAEFAARTRKIPIKFAVLLHQGLMRYASNVSLAVQLEWRKIEGRFETLQFVDDSKQLYELVAEIVQQYICDQTPTESELRLAITRCRDTGIFNDFPDQELTVLLTKAYPLEPISLFLLPRISSRVAQNERTLFTFLYNQDGRDYIGPEVVFDYFAESMRSDTSVGGTYHNWLETQSALTKIDSSIDSRTLKCACLLGLGLLGERSRVSRKLLSFGTSGYGHGKTANDSVGRLIAAKLLLYRKNTDSVSIWHGTDVDLRGKLEERKRRLSASFDLVSFLDREVPPLAWKAIEHNSTYYIERHFESRYISIQEFICSEQPFEDSETLDVSDGILYLLVPETDNEINQIHARLSTSQVTDPHVLLSIPQRTERIFEIALEVHALNSLAEDSALLAEDPLVAPELDQMIDDGQGYLNSVLDRVYEPSPIGPTYFHQDRFIQIQSRRELRSFLSQIMNETYPLTPKINNELIVRRIPRPVIVNARKKLVLGILERSGIENVGIEGYRPDMSMFRTVLLNTGLYHRTNTDSWLYARPEEIGDLGLSKVWRIMRTFLSRPSSRRKSFSTLFDKLRRPPYGLRNGVFPILLAAALRAFPSALSITKTDGTYISDILPTTIEDICTNPDDYRITVVSLDNSQRKYLSAIYRLFAPAGDISSRETDPLRRCYDALVRWRNELPAAAFSSSQFSSQTQKVRTLLGREQDPYLLFLHRLPQAFGRKRVTLNSIMSRIEESKREMEDVVAVYYAAAKRSLLYAFGFDGDEEARPFLQEVFEWANCFPREVENVMSEGLSKAFLSRARIHYDSEESLIDSLCSLVIGKRVNRWDDSTITLFDREIHSLVNRIEESVLSDRRLSSTAERLVGIRKLAIARFRNMYHKLVTIVGFEETKAIVESIVNDRKK